MGFEHLKVKYVEVNKAKRWTITEAYIKLDFERGADAQFAKVEPVLVALYQALKNVADDERTELPRELWAIVNAALALAEGEKP